MLTLRDGFERSPHFPTIRFQSRWGEFVPPQGSQEKEMLLGLLVMRVMFRVQPTFSELCSLSKSKVVTCSITSPLIADWSLTSWCSWWFLWSYGCHCTRSPALGPPLWMMVRHHCWSAPTGVSSANLVRVLEPWVGTQSLVYSPEEHQYWG